jgi:hypothetical protein
MWQFNISCHSALSTPWFLCLCRCANGKHSTAHTLDAYAAQYICNHLATLLASRRWGSEWLAKQVGIRRSTARRSTGVASIQHDDNYHSVYHFALFEKLYGDKWNDSRDLFDVAVYHKESFRTIYYIIIKYLLATHGFHSQKVSISFQHVVNIGLEYQAQPSGDKVELKAVHAGGWNHL